VLVLSSEENSINIFHSLIRTPLGHRAFHGALATRRAFARKDARIYNIAADLCTLFAQQSWPVCVWCYFERFVFKIAQAMTPAPRLLFLALSEANTRYFRNTDEGASIFRINKGWITMMNWSKLNKHISIHTSVSSNRKHWYFINFIVLNIWMLLIEILILRFFLLYITL